MIYRVMVEIEPGGPGGRLFTAVVPDIPRCFTVAASWEELEVNLREVVELALEMESAAGRQYPPIDGFSVQVDLPAA
jgi:predicted RNase H-like HicB family nuclease